MSISFVIHLCKIFVFLMKNLCLQQEDVRHLFPTFCRSRHHLLRPIFQPGVFVCEVAPPHGERSRLRMLEHLVIPFPGPACLRIRGCTFPISVFLHMMDANVTLRISLSCSGVNDNGPEFS